MPIGPQNVGSSTSDVMGERRPRANPSVEGLDASAGTKAPAIRRAAAVDRDLIPQLIAGDETAFAELFERYHGAMLRLALVFVPRRAIAEEVVQDTWIGVLRGLPSFEGRSSLRTWIFRILVNRAKSCAMREGRTLLPSSQGDGSLPGDSAADCVQFQSDGRWAQTPRRWNNITPDELLMQREALASAERAIAALPPPQRAVITLRDVEGIDAREICNILAISETNLRVLLHRARSTVRRALAEHMDRG